MAGFIRRWGFLALAAPASGLRQPIHADDAARAVVAAMDNVGAQNKAIGIAGGETLTYKDMALRVFAALGREPRIVMLPTVAQKALQTAAKAGLVKRSVARAFQRMNQDVVCDMAEGLRLLDYQPRPFKPEFL
jgi:nucleoside-diphosphate-sugar epimerase